MSNESLRQTEQDHSSSTSDSVSPSDAIVKSTLRKPILHHDDHEHAATLPRRPAGRISMTLINFWLDGLLAVVFVKLCLTSVILQFVFPPGVAARGAMLWGMSYGQWCSLQFGLLAVLGFGVLIHVMLHWTWVCSVLSKRVLKQSEVPDNGIRTLYGVGLLIGLLLLGAVSIGVAQWMIVLP